MITRELDLTVLGAATAMVPVPEGAASAAVEIVAGEWGSSTPAVVKLAAGLLGQVNEDGTPGHDTGDQASADALLLGVDVRGLGMLVAYVATAGSGGDVDTRARVAFGFSEAAPD